MDHRGAFRKRFLAQAARHRKVYTREEAVGYFKSLSGCPFDGEVERRTLNDGKDYWLNPVSGELVKAA